MSVDGQRGNTSAARQITARVIITGHGGDVGHNGE